MNITRVLRLSVGVCLTGIFLGLGGCAASSREPALTPEQRELHVRSFDQVWETIRDKHFDAKLGGLDWDEIRNEYRPKVEQANNRADVRRSLNQMIARLDLTHFGILPAEATAAMDIETPEEKRSGQSGIEIRVIEGQAIVTHVMPDSPAANAGVKPGWIVESVRGKPLAEGIRKVSEAYEGKSLHDLVTTGAAANRLQGSIGESVPVRFLDETDTPRDLDIPMIAPDGAPARFGLLPTFYVRTEERTLSGGIGYFSLNAFFDPAKVMPAFQTALRNHADAPGLIIDLRGNPGGIGAMAMGMAGWFVREEGHKLGVMKMRTTEVKFAVFPRRPHYDPPVAILIDGLSGSTAEIFSAGMRDLERARLFGRRTAGAALPSTVETLPNGDGFQYAFADYVSEKGQRLEGEGVTPHETVTLTREALLAGRDPDIEAAIAWIRQESMQRGTAVASTSGKSME